MSEVHEVTPRDLDSPAATTQAPAATVVPLRRAANAGAGNTRTFSSPGPAKSPRCEDRRGAGARVGAQAPDDLEDHGPVERFFRQGLSLSHDLEPALRGVLEQTLESPGSLARARIAYDVMTGLGCPQQQALDLAIGVEYLHTASLLFDDLPAMDDATERRGRTCAHVRFGEAPTLLGALGLIARGYELLWASFGPLDARRRAAAGALVGSCLGPDGVIDGQARDLGFVSWAGREPSPEDVLDVARGKTVTLIRLSIVLPGLVAGADRDEIAELERVAESSGLAYQVLDDCKDVLMSAQESGKSTARDEQAGRPNFPSVAGWGTTIAFLRDAVATVADANDRLCARRTSWSALRPLQMFLAAELAQLELRLACPLRPARAV